MPILGRNPFNHSSTHLNEKSDQNSPSPNRYGNDNNNSHNHGVNPPLKRSSKSFLSFMSRKPSMESIRSDKSSDSLNHSNFASPITTNNTPDIHGHGSHPHGNHGHGHSKDLYDHSPVSPKPSHSMVELKRFFRSAKILNMTHTHHEKSSTNLNNTARHAKTDKHAVHNNHPHSSTQLNLNSHYQMSSNDANRASSDHYGHTQSAIPPSSDSVLSLSNTINIYHDDTILAQKYGRLGKTLGSGAGGSVKVLVRPSDGATFAVKEFRPRKSNESVKQYAKKCTAEFCIGSSLHHPNIVETIDIFSDSNQFKYFQVMEFLPIDFFGVVMTGQMSRGEINCCLKQLCDGVRYLHSMGLAHRDLKLDNCCMTEYGILKIIDFGSAVVFKYPFEDVNTTHSAHGIVGSDPYLAPEVITSTKSYDPQAVDVWSIGIIFCCMMLKRFPWKAPKMSDDNYKLYSLPDDIERDYNQSAMHHEQLLTERRRHRDHGLRGEEHNHIGNYREYREHPAEKNIIKEKEEEQPEQQRQPQSPIPEERKEEVEETDEKPKITQLPTPEHDKTNQSDTDEKSNNHDNSVKESNEVNEKNQKPNYNNTNNDNAHDNKSIISSRSSIHTQQNGHPNKKVIHGPYRLLRLLPHASRPILSKMLEIDPKKRATLTDIFNDEWFANVPACTMDSKSSVIRAHGHHHTIVKEGKTYKI